jgi:hypothetical protein
MKKNCFIVLTLLLSTTFVNAQGVFDAVRFATPAINGTARYMSMAGSFGALGGDVSAIIDNPATLGIFRSNEFNLSVKLLPTSTIGTWDSEKYKANSTSFKLNNFSWVLNLPSNRETGYMASNFSFGYVKVKDFNRSVALKTRGYGVSLTDLMASMTDGLNERDLQFDDANDYNPYNNVDIGWLSVLGYQSYLIDPDTISLTPNKWNSLLQSGEKVNPKYQATESGNVANFNFSYSGNINDILYFGTGVSMQTLNYLLTSQYGEDFEFGGNFDLGTLLKTDGVGVNFNFGLIYRPFSAFRFGASFQTPTYYSMNDKNYAVIKLGNGYFTTSNEALTEYRFKAPLKFQLSAGAVVGTTAAFNIDYQYSALNKMKFGDYDHDAFTDLYSYDNKDISNLAKATSTIKIGAEVRVAEHVKVRGGFAYTTSPILQKATRPIIYNTVRTDMEYFTEQSQMFASCGIGFNWDKLFLDFAYMYNRRNQTFMPFTADAKSAQVASNYHNIVTTLVWRY